MHRRARQMKHLANQQYLRNPDPLTLNVYQTESFSHLMRSSRRKYETGIVSVATSYPKVFFGYVQRNRHLSRQIV